MAVLIRSLPQPVASPIELKTKTVFSDEYGTDFIDSYDINVSKLNDAEIEWWREYLTGVVEPGERMDILSELTKLKLVTASRAQSDEGMEAILAAYISDLQTYPIWVIRRACLACKKSSQWFPTIFDITKEADKLVSGIYELNRQLTFAAIGRKSGLIE
jgi:hypothetical protein